MIATFQALPAAAKVVITAAVLVGVLLLVGHLRSDGDTDSEVGSFDVIEPSTPVSPDTSNPDWAAVDQLVPVSGSELEQITRLVRSVVATFAEPISREAQEARLASIAVDSSSSIDQARAIGPTAIAQRFTSVSDTVVVVDVVDGPTHFDFTFANLGTWQLSNIAPSHEPVEGLPPSLADASSPLLGLPLEASQLADVAAVSEQIVGVLSTPAMDVASKNARLAALTVTPLVYDTQGGQPRPPASAPKARNFEVITRDHVVVRTSVGNDVYSVDVVFAAGWKAESVSSDSCADGPCQLRPDDGSYTPPDHDEH